MLPAFRLFSRAVASQCTAKRYFKTTSTSYLFWEEDDKGGYREDRKYPPFKERMREGLKELRKEVAIWKQEVKEHFEGDPVLIFRPGEVDVQWQFKDEENLDKWIITTDKDNNEGYSTASLGLTKHSKGLFSGNLNMRVPKDGRIKRAGYCNMRTIRARVNI